MTQQTQALDLVLVSPLADTVATGDDVWLRLEQITEDDLITTAEIAELVDALYQVDPCLTPVEAADVAETANTLPDNTTIADLLALAAEKLSIAECSRRKSGDYTARVKIIRSHLIPIEENKYTLRPSVGEITGISPTNENIVQTINVNDQSSITLDYPVLQGEDEEWPGSAKWLGSVWTTKDGAIKPPKITGNGRVLSWSPACTGTIIARFDTTYDIATLSVPGIPAATAGAVGSTQPCTLRAFYRYQVYEAEITAVNTDTQADADSLAAVCGWADLDGGTAGTGTSGTGASDSDDDADSADDDDDAPPTGCLSPNSNLASRAFYRKTCCKEPPFSLPDCSVYATAKPALGLSPEIQAAYKKTSGKRVNFVAVGPGPDGCGRIFIRQNVNPINCCDDTTPMSPSPDNPTSMGSSSVIGLSVENGLKFYPWKWRASGGLFFYGGATEINGDASELVYSPEVWCERGTVRVDDGCTVLTMQIENLNPPEPFSLSYSGIEDESSNLVFGSVAIEIDGGVPPYILETKGEHTYFVNGEKEIEVNGGPVQLFVDDAQVCLGDFAVNGSDGCMETDSVTIPVSEATGIVRACYWTGGFTSLIIWAIECAPLKIIPPKWYRISGFDTPYSFYSSASCLPTGEFWLDGAVYNIAEREVGGYPLTVKNYVNKREIPNPCPDMEPCK